MIRFHLCTISFRHHLVSLPELADWAKRNDFDGIELWAVHARHLDRQPALDGHWIERQGLRIPMVSDYLPLDGSEAEALRKTREACRLAKRWHANKVRTFAGPLGSDEVSPSQRRAMTRRLKTLTQCVADEGLSLMLETHPGTLADTVGSTLELLSDIDHSALGINFDVLHVWESGANPLVALKQLAPWVHHCHFKNIQQHSQLGVFAPANVYSPAGTREGMVPVLEGACDYRPILAELGAWQSEGIAMDVSLEWFGADSYRVLNSDLRQLRRVLAEQCTQPQAVAGFH